MESYCEIVISIRDGAVQEVRLTNPYTVVYPAGSPLYQPGGLSRGRGSPGPRQLPGRRLRPSLPAKHPEGARPLLEALHPPSGRAIASCQLPIPSIKEQYPMDFLDVRTRLVQNFQRAAAEKPLFQVALNQRKLWALYLNSFPDGTNPLYRTRHEYDCDCCRHFFDAAGSIVYIDGQLTLHSLFDFDAGDPAFQQVMDALDAFVKAHPIAGPYIASRGEVGAPRSSSVDSQGDVHIWRHFFLPCLRRPSAATPRTQRLPKHGPAPIIRCSSAPWAKSPWKPSIRCWS